ncbi:MAG TPA: Ig-like domain-containing protein [Acidimicrobiales bacterium]
MPGGKLIVTLNSPSSGSTVSGTVPVSASVSIVGGLIAAGVRFRVDGVTIGGEDTSSPYSVSWNTRTVANGSHTLTAVARDILGGQWTSNSVTVTVFNDTTAPTVSITSPANGATVSGTIAINANASDSVGVAGVRFRLNGANLGSEDTSAPYSVSWNTTGVANGTHTLTAVARDAAGNTRTSAPITVTVNNADTTPPTVSVTSPANGATVSGTITVTANASDNRGVVGVRFRLNGVNLGAEDTTNPYSVSWNTTGVANGSHTLTAVARDAAGNTKTSASVTVTVNNAPPADTTPPTVSITSPANGATVSGTITVAASASDNVGVVGVEFFLDGALGGDDTTAPFSIPWDTTTAANGTHTLTAVARDAAGNRRTSTAVTVNVSNGGSGGARFEEDNPAVSAAPAAAWVRRGPEVAAFSGGAAGSSDTAGATVTFTFSGTQVTWIGLKCSICGDATVTIDGGAATPVNTGGAAAPGSPGLASEPVFTASGLAPGTHTLVITVTGTTSTSGAHVIVDAFDVTGGTGSAATRFEADDPSITGSPAGAWVMRGPETAVFSGGSAGSSDVAGATASFTFTGRQVSWIGLRCNACGIATVSIDGGAASQVNTAGPTAPGTPGLASEAVFTASGLSAGSHTLVITVTGNTTSGGAHVIVDAFDVTP